MLAFLIQRVLQAIFVMFVVALISFSLFHYVGDPVLNMLGQEATEADRAALRAQLGLDQPVVVQFWNFIVNAAQFEFGISYRSARPVTDLILERLPATLELAIISAIFAVVMGILLGIYTALRRRSWLANFIMTASLIGVSLPTFLIGVLLIYIFAVELGMLPAFGRGQTVRLGDWWTTGLLTTSGLRSLILPAITLGLFQLTLIMRLVRAEMLEVLSTDYIKFARARGLSKRVVHLRHALKNTMIPVITIIGLQLGTIIAFAIITETVFQWPGVGALFITAVRFVDVPVMAAYLMMIALVFVVINLVVDLLYYAVDPRLRAQGGGK
ncbi:MULTISPECIES: ABC transporter permease [Halomonadaceae]|jgi:peptide/nickel transport system permease protein|uniref:ABC transporter permease n=1 Tax=Billgrantia aerodenitrificans TaxID=2733483 RepID=A0ABS9AQ17_9GAMM|nr:MULTISPECIES: ABC transporter permease [Halomonas]MCE8023737.1 ABC transporter permease [Halomonas aerodenitrificans]